MNKSFQLNFLAHLVSYIMFSFRRREDDAVVQDGPKIKLQTLTKIWR